MVKQVGYTFVGIVAIIVALVLSCFILATIDVLVNGGWKWLLVAVAVAVVVYAVNRFGKVVYHQLPCHG